MSTIRLTADKIRHPKISDEHPHPFHMRSPPRGKGPSWRFAGFKEEIDAFSPPPPPCNSIVPLFEQPVESNVATNTPTLGGGVWIVLFSEHRYPVWGEYPNNLSPIVGKCVSWPVRKEKIWNHFALWRTETTAILTVQNTAFFHSLLIFLK